LDNSIKLVKSSGSELDLASVVSEVKVGKLRKLDNTGRVTSGEADSLPRSESIDNFESVSSFGSSRPGSTEGSAVVDGSEVSDLLDRLGTSSDSLVRVDGRVSGEIVRVLDSNSNNDVEGISVHEEEGTLSSEGAHGSSARELASNISAVDNFLVASVDSLVLSFDNVSLNLVLGNALGKRPVDVNETVSVSNSDSRSSHGDDISGLTSTGDDEGSLLRPVAVRAAAGSSSHLDVEGSALRRRSSSSDSVSVKGSVEEGLVKGEGSPDLVSALLSNTSFVRGSSDASVACVVESGPRKGGSTVGL
jgi:hypothetical protein